MEPQFSHVATLQLPSPMNKIILENKILLDKKDVVSWDLYTCGSGLIYHPYNHQTKIHFEPITAVLNCNWLHKRIVHPIKHRTEFYIFVRSKILWEKSVSHRHQQRKNRRSAVTNTSEPWNPLPWTHQIQLAIGHSPPRMWFQRS